MRVSTAALYLIGNREAIETIVSDRRAVGVGFVFVISAGLAREYDGTDLLSEPERLLLPFGASLTASFLIFCLVCGVGSGHGLRNVPFWRTYRALLTLFWMTAPLAWLYAIPYERFLSPVEAMRANLWTLGIVAAWRVVLMTRVISRIAGCGVVAALMLVMLVSDGLALVSIWALPTPVIQTMGGVRLSGSEQLLLGTRFLVLAIGSLTMPIWLVGCAVVSLANAHPWRPMKITGSEARQPVWPMRALAWASVLGWLPILWLTQPEQQLRARIEKALNEGRASETLAELSSHDPADYPPHWETTLASRLREDTGRLMQVMDALVNDPPAPWVRRICVGAFGETVGRLYWLRPDATQLREYGRILGRIREGPDIVSNHRERIELLRNAVEEQSEIRTVLDEILMLNPRSEK